MKILILVILFGVIGVLSYLTYTAYLNPKIEVVERVKEVQIVNSDKSDFEIEIEQIRSVPIQPKEISDLKIHGWIPDWDMRDGLNTLRNNPQIKSVSPFWFDLNADGSLKTTSLTNWGEFINYTRNNNIELIPSITSFDKDKMTQVLNSTENSQRLISQILENVEKFDYQGIDLDFESFYRNDQKLLFDLLKGLKDQLNQRGKKLYFSPLAKWGNLIEYGQTKSTLDYKLLADNTDMLLIQGYSYTANGSSQIGPIGPLEWLEDLIRYAIKEGVPREKITLGIHTYAIDWSEREIQYDLLYYTPEGLSNADNSMEQGVAYYHNGVDKLLSNYSVDLRYIENWGEMLGSYDFNGQKRFVVYPTEQSIQQRKELAAKYGLAGISYWRLGDEGSLKL